MSDQTPAPAPEPIVDPAQAPEPAPEPIGDPTPAEPTSLLDPVEGQPFVEGHTLADGTVLSADEAKMLNKIHKLEPEPVEPANWVDDRFKVVNKESGEVDLDATGRKMAESYKNLEAKLKERRRGGPEDITGYTRDNIPEGLEVGDDFFEGMLDADLSDTQAQKVLALLGDKFVPALDEANRGVQEKLLRAQWGLSGSDSDAAYKQELKAVGAWAIEQFGEEQAKALTTSANSTNALRAAMHADRGANSVHDFKRTGSSTTAKEDYSQALADSMNPKLTGVQQQAAFEKAAALAERIGI